MNKSVDIRNDFLDLKLADGMDLDLQLSAGHHPGHVPALGPFFTRVLGCTETIVSIKMKI